VLLEESDEDDPEGESVDDPAAADAPGTPAMDDFMQAEERL